MFHLLSKIILFLSPLFFSKSLTKVQLYPEFANFKVFYSHSRLYLLDYFYNMYYFGNFKDLKDLFGLTPPERSIRGILNHTKRVVRQIYESITPGDYIHLQCITFILGVPELLYMQYTASNPLTFNLDIRNELIQFYEGCFIVPSDEYYTILHNLRFLNKDELTGPLYDEWLYVSYDHTEEARYEHFQFYFKLYLQNVKIVGSKIIPEHLKQYMPPNYDASLNTSQLEYIKKSYVPRVEIKIVQYFVYDESNPYAVHSEVVRHLSSVKTLI